MMSLDVSIGIYPFKTDLVITACLFYYIFYIPKNRTRNMNTRGKHSPIFLMTAIIMVVMLGLTSSISSLFAQGSLHSGHIANNTTSKYRGQEGRIIKSLSPEDIESLQTGTGDAFGGMAKLAELNCYPCQGMYWI
jgi:hypothetical protein